MSSVQVAGPAMNELFNSTNCNIGNGTVIISLRTCDIRINPAVTIDNAAKLAAKTIYQVMAHTENLSGEPEWVNAVTFASEEFEKTPAIRITDNQLFVNSPPFLKTKKNILFWKKTSLLIKLQFELK